MRQAEKIDDFATSYKNVEPENAKALGFDYNIMIIQPEYDFSLYPGEKKVQGELTLSNEFSSHSMWGGIDPYSQRVVYFDCNFNPQEHPELCENTELDSIICSDCTENPRENCPYPHKGSGRSGICCVYYDCPIDACDSVEVKMGMGDCGSGCTVALGCNLKRCSKLYYGHGACGMTYDYTWIPSGETINVDIEEKVWSFGVSLGVNSFSPEKAKKEEMQLSIPVTIRYNDTFSAEGTLYIYAVRGELESVYGVIEDVCERAKLDDSMEIDFSKEFSFSYPVRYDDNEICMLDSCKFLDCPYELEFENIEETGSYLLQFSFNPDNKIIEVRK